MARRRVANPSSARGPLLCRFLLCVHCSSLSREVPLPPVFTRGLHTQKSCRCLSLEASSRARPCRGSSTLRPWPLRRPRLSSHHPFVTPSSPRRPPVARFGGFALLIHGFLVARLLVGCSPSIRSGELSTTACPAICCSGYCCIGDGNCCLVLCILNCYSRSSRLQCVSN